MAVMINGERIEDVSIQDEMERLKPHYDRQFADSPMTTEEKQRQLWDWSRENLIERTLLSQESRKRVANELVTVDQVEAEIAQLTKQAGGEEEFAKRLEENGMSEGKLRLEIDGRLRTEIMLDDVCKELSPPSSEEIEDFYREHVEEFKTPEMVRASHIVQHVTRAVEPEAARAVMEEVDKKLHQGEDFEDLASKFSDCPDKGGDLGYFPRGEMVQEFEDAVFGMEVGEISGVFQTQYGFHIAKLVDKIPEGQRPLRDVEGDIRQRLFTDKKNRAVEAFIDDLKAQAAIEDV